MGLGSIALSVGQNVRSGQASRLVDIIEFVEAPWGLNVRLYPVQKIILKAHYGLELDNKTTFKISDWRRQAFRDYTEASYLEYLFSEGRCNIKTVVPGQERRELILSIGRRSGKCILGDSLVLTDQGISRIADLGDPDGPEIQTLEVGVAQEGRGKSRSAYFYNGGIRATRTLTTRCGYQLGGTDNHRIKILTKQGCVEWVALDALQVGDVVCIHRNTNLWASKYVDCTPFHNTQGLRELAFPTQLTEDWGRLLGYLVGDGLWNYRGRVEVTVEHPETWETLKSLYSKLLGGYSVVMNKRTKNTGAIKFGSVGMRKFLHDLGFSLGTDRDAKMVPWAILKSPCSVVQAFLRGLFETDGGVESKGKVVSFSTASGRLAREVQTLLLNFGIISRIKPKIIKGRVYWILIVRGRRSRLAFAKQIGFDSHKKMDPLLMGLSKVSREGGDTESIPNQRGWVNLLLKSVLKVQPKPGQKQKWCRSILRQVLGNSTKPSSNDDITYPRLLEVLPIAEQLGASEEVIQHFRGLQKMDYFFDPVTAIEESQNPVYDLNVPDGESFVANGMTNHNTFLAAAIAAYETYKLILKGNPQAYYGIANNIQIIAVATDKDQAGLLYQDVSGHFRSCGFFLPYVANNTQSYARFQTPADIAKYGRYTDDPSAKASIRITFRSCIAKGLRGPGNIVVVLDEVAHFTDEGQSSAEAVYNAVTPSTATFSPKDPNDNRVPTGPVEGRIISISSPLGRQGQFYKLFQIAMSGGSASSNMLAIQAPTWEVNPTLPAHELEKFYLKDVNIFFTEFGAQFLDATRGWLENAQDLEECIDRIRRPMVQGASRVPHFVGIDVGLVNDASAIAIGHIDGEQRIVLDLIDQIKAGEGKYADQERLDFEGVADWVLSLSRKFYFAHGMFDQWAGIPFEQALEKRGLKQLKSEHITKPINSKIFQNFKDMMWDHRLVLYDWPLSQGNSGHCDYIQELLELQAQHQSKYVTVVEAPNIDGKHDDRSDALVRMVWLASQHMGQTKYIAGGRAVPVVRYRDMGQPRQQANRRGYGTSPDRQPSRLARGQFRGRR